MNQTRSFLLIAWLAVAFLLTDLLLQRPPGLWAVLALIGVENLKSRGRHLRDASFAAEWLTVAVILTMVIMYQFPGIALWFPDYLFGVYIP